MRAGRHSGQNFKVCCASPNPSPSPSPNPNLSPTLFLTLSKRNPNPNPNQVFCAAFNRLQDQCRVAALVDTVGKAQAAFNYNINSATAPAAGARTRTRMARPRRRGGAVGLARAALVRCLASPARHTPTTHLRVPLAFLYSRPPRAWGSFEVCRTV